MRSIWKGIYQPLNSLKQLTVKSSEPLRLYARALFLTKVFVGQSLIVYNGRKFTALKPTELHLEHRVGEFARTRAFFIPKVKKKKAKAKKKKIKTVSKAKKKK